MEMKVFQQYPLISRFLLAVLFPLCVGIAVTFFYLKSSIAPIAGTLKVDGLNYTVEITHDTYGVPRIVAKTDHDAYFALGFKHASDRLWQLEVQRRLAQGRLSELFGVEALPQDIMMRNLGLYQAAKQSLPLLKNETLAALTAYTDGINAWINQSSNLPIEFKLLNVRPEPWNIVDSLSWQKVFALMLSGNMMDELRRNQLQNHISPEQMRFIYPYDPVKASVKNTPINGKLLSKSDTLIAFGIGHLFAGSNAWVVAGKYTQSGHPIIANDPHLGLQLPAAWYVASIKGDRLNVSGMTLVGLPIVVFGQNDDGAWVGTNLMSDQQDLFVETTSPQKPNQYLDGEEWKDFESHTEQINISAPFPAFLHEKLKPINIVIRKTERGPIISDIRTETNAVISLRWAALDAEDHTLDAFIDIQYAKNWFEFRQSLAQLKSPGLNFLYADRMGNIGYQAAGMMPKRAFGVGTISLVASKQNNWQGYHDFSQLPSIYNPDKGYIVSANEKIDHSPDISISHEWAPKARHDRITTLIQQAIDAKKLMTVSDMSAIQGDRLDLTALALLPFLKRVTAETPQEKEALSVLNKWNGEFTSDSIGATLFATWSYYLKHEIFDKRLNHNWARPEETELLFSSLERVGWEQLAQILASDTNGFCKAQQPGKCAQEIHNSLTLALKQLTKISGTESISQWKWSDFTHAEFIHQPFGNVKGLEWLFKRSVHSVASPDSVNASNIPFDPLKGFSQNLGAGFRQVFELDKTNSHVYMLSTGESGNVISKHFDDMLLPFSKNQLIPFAMSKQSGEILSLIPLRESR